MEQLKQEIPRDSAALLAISLTRDAISTDLPAARPDRPCICQRECRPFPHQPPARRRRRPCLAASGSLATSSTLTSAPASPSNPPLTSLMSFGAATFDQRPDISNEECNHHPKSGRYRSSRPKRVGQGLLNILNFLDLKLWNYEVINIYLKPQLCRILSHSPP
jgi:hypothetical protein